jgi:hypothetical protein
MGNLADARIDVADEGCGRLLEYQRGADPQASRRRGLGEADQHGIGGATRACGVVARIRPVALQVEPE